jgi:predicted GNAT family acetyltransferase
MAMGIMGTDRACQTISGAHQAAEKGAPVRASRFVDRPSQLEVRELRREDRAQLEALLAIEPGFSLFLANNLHLFDVPGAGVRFWGAFAERHMRAALMMVEKRAALYAPDSLGMRPLARVAGAREVEFVMGRSDLVRVVLEENPGLPVQRHEEHAFAGLAPRDFHPVAKRLPDGVAVRRAGAADTMVLTHLYTGAAGFEEMTTDQIYRTMRGRVTVMRTYLAEAHGRALAAASTSAEARAAAMIGGVWTAPEWRGRGLSQAVVSALSGALLAEARMPYLFYQADNGPAARVYANIGFRPAGQWTVVYFGEPDTA